MIYKGGSSFGESYPCKFNSVDKDNIINVKFEVRISNTIKIKGLDFVRKTRLIISINYWKS